MNAKPAVDHEQEFVSLKELAIRWQCSRTTAARWLRDAGIRKFYFGRGTNGSVRFLKSDIDEFLRRLERDE